MKKVVVTGGAGFIGTALVHALVDGGCEVHVIDNFSTGTRENIHPQATYHELDVTKGYENLKPICEAAKSIFHLAAAISVPYSIEHPEETSANIQGTLNVLQAAKEMNVERVVFISSAAVYGNQPTPVAEGAQCEPISPYGLEKLAGEEYCKLFSRIYNLSTVTARLFNIYGPKQTNKDGALIPTVLEKTKQKESVVVYGSGKQLRDFIFVEDAIEAFLRLDTSDIRFKGEVFNVGSGVGTSVMHIVRLVTDGVEQVPERLEIRDSVADISKIKGAVGWYPRTTIEEGIKKTKEAYDI